VVRHLRGWHLKGDFHRNVRVSITTGLILLIAGGIAAASGAGQVAMALVIAGFSLVLGYTLALMIRRQQARYGRGDGHG